MTAARPVSDGAGWLSLPGPPCLGIIATIMSRRGGGSKVEKLTLAEYNARVADSETPALLEFTAEW